MDNKLRVNSKTKYTIEVNDNGETIEFDLADIGLTAKFMQCYEEIGKVTKEFTLKEQEYIEKILKENEELGENKPLFTETEKEYIKLQQEFYAKARECVDIFIGKGGCQKIFGDTNYPNMFFDLFEQLQPQLKQMGLNKQKMEQDFYTKYMKKGNKTLK